MLWPTPRSRRVSGDRNEQDRGDECSGRDGRCRSVHERRSLDVDARARPEPAELSVGLKRRRARTTLQACLPVLNEAWKERRERDAARKLHGCGRRRAGAHAMSPIRTAIRSDEDEPDEVGDIRRQAPALQATCLARAHQALRA